MAQFVYTAKTIIGESVRGQIESNTVDGAVDHLQKQELIVVSIREKRPTFSIGQIDTWLNRVSIKEVTFFARQLAVMIEATIPMVRALRMLGKHTKNPSFKNIIEQVSSDVDNGSKLSQALARHPAAFDQLFIHMVRSGETTGRLDRVLEYLAEQKEKDYALRSRIRGAMVYPAFIVSVMVVIGIIMMVFVVPRLTAIIEQSGGDLPLATQILTATSGFIVGYWWLVLLLGMVAGVGYGLYIRTANGRYTVDYLKIKLPIVGPLYQKVAMARFAISFSNLLSSGVPVTKALSIVGDIVGNRVYHDIIQRAIVQVEAGNPIAAEFNQTEVIPPIVPQMISVGEETGRLDEILKKLSRFYTREVESALAALTSIIEPLIIVALGFGALVMVAGVLLPIYSVTTTIG